MKTNMIHTRQPRPHVTVLLGKLGSQKVCRQYSLPAPVIAGCNDGKLELPCGSVTTGALRSLAAGGGVGREQHRVSAVGVVASRGGAGLVAALHLQLLVHAHPHLRGVFKQQGREGSSLSPEGPSAADSRLWKPTGHSDQSSMCQ